MAWKTLALVLASLGGAGTLAAADAQPWGAPKQPSWTDSLGASFKKGVDSVTGVFTSKPQKEPAQDAVSLSSEARPGPQTRAAVARLYEDSGRFAEADEQYRQALVASPKDVRTLMSYARLKIRMGDLAEATRLYQRAAKIAPKDAMIHNDLGLCFAQRKLNSEAVASLQQAIDLQPSQALYRNNMAAVLVDAGRNDEALAQLRAVHSEDVAHYNLGYLLNKKGRVEEATRHFFLAWKANPSLHQARWWLERLSNPQSSTEAVAGAPGAQPNVPARPAVEPRPEGVLIADRRSEPAVVQPLPALPRATTPSEVAPLPPGGTLPGVDATSPWSVQRAGELERLPPVAPLPPVRR